jgi:hypothetical protein
MQSMGMEDTAAYANTSPLMKPLPWHSGIERKEVSEE